VRAARLVAPGDPPTFDVVDVITPEPGEGEVAVDLEAAALNRRDWWIWRNPDTPVPVTLGSDGAGRVGAVGPGVTGLEVGQEVVIDATLGWGDSEEAGGEQFDILGSPTEGTFAERVIVPAGNVAPKPSRLSFEEAAALNLGGLTAWRAAVTCARVGEGRTLLVTGAGSGVSTFVIQIAVELGTRVVVTSGSQAKIDRAIELGAIGGCLYTDEDWPDTAMALAGGPLDAAVDSFGAGVWAGALRALRRGGRLVSFGDTGGPGVTIPLHEVYWEWRSVIGTTMGSPSEFRALLAHVETASWKPVIDSVYGLNEIAAAAARLTEPDRFGKVVIRP
jgi:NADPH:quinone reductase-like Zn-dependent oxidoreductase